jgi:hypothetical protein
MSMVQRTWKADFVSAKHDGSASVQMIQALINMSGLESAGSIEV